MRSFKVRRVYRRISCCLIALAACATNAAAPAREIARDTYLVRGEFPEGRQPDGNSILLLAPQGVIVIDTGRHIAHTQRILELAKAQRRSVAAIVNTHWHLDHIGGNALLREAFPAVTVYASDAFAAARSGFLRDYRAQLEQALTQAQSSDDTARWRAELRLIDAADALAPNRVIASTGRMLIAGRPLMLHVERRSVTAADVWIEDPATQSVFAGDLVTLPVPFFDTACPTGWSLALGRIAERPFTTLVPGHGAPMTRRQFEIYRTAFTNLLACSAASESQVAAPLRAARACAEGWISDLGALLEVNEHRRVGTMLDYYLQMLRSAARNKHC